MLPAMDHEPMARLEIDGLRVFHVPRPGRTRAVLWFGVGHSDETFATRGVTHVVEHLAMTVPAAGKFERNASVDRSRTAFWASGRPEQVGAFLNDVVRGLGDLPVDRLGKERSVIAAECATLTFGPHEALLFRRFGNGTFGLGCFPDLGPRATDADVVGEHVRRWFVRDNAVLTILGTMPEGLSLRLPDGRAPERHYERMLRGPGWVTGDAPDPALSFEVPEGVVSSLVLRAMSERLERELRDERGLAYAVMPDVVRLAGERRMVLQVAVAAAPGAGVEVATALVDELHRRAREGVSPEEIAEDLEWFDALEAEPEYDEWRLDRSAEMALLGLDWEPGHEGRATLEGVTREETAELVAASLDTALVIVPETPPEGFPVGPTNGCSMSTQLSTPVLKRRLMSRAPKGTLLGFDGSRLEYQDADGDVHQVRLDECVGVGIGTGKDAGGRLVFGRRGCHVWVHPSEYQGADRVVNAIDSAVPAALRFELT